jgi:hypothetical protein
MSAISLTSLQSKEPMSVQGQHRRATIVVPVLATMAAIILVFSLVVESRLSPAQRGVSFESFQIYP